MIRWAVLLLTAAALVAGCSRPPASQEPTLTPQTPTATEQPAPTAPGVAADMVLPRDNASYIYNLSGDSLVEEAYVRDGDRLIGSYNGKVYVTWFITPEGVYRLDPKGKVLLRYLPPVLPDDEVAWKQTSGGEAVWFDLRRVGDCHGYDALVKSACWSLTVLNRGERVSYLLGLGQGIIKAESANLVKPAESYTKDLAGAGQTPPPAREVFLRDGARRPDGALPTVTAVEPAAFEAEAKALPIKYGANVTAVDLDGDGKPEYLQGALGKWHREPLQLYRNDSSLVEHAFYSLPESPTVQHMAEVVTVPGLPQPALVYHAGQPDQAHQATVRFLRDGKLVGVWGWAPKTDLIWGTYVSIEQDGTVVVTNAPAEMAGYTWVRRYRIVEEKTENWAPLRANLVGETVTVGAYPTEPDELLTAAFVAHWYKAPADLARYAPNEAVQQAMAAQQGFTRPNYVPDRAETGKLTWRTVGTPGTNVPEIAPAPPSADGSTEFLVTVGLYEGYNYWTGHVTFGKADDGRLIITAITFEKTGFIY
jgi:hypothetical protein